MYSAIAQHQFDCLINMQKNNILHMVLHILTLCGVFSIKIDNIQKSLLRLRFFIRHKISFVEDENKKQEYEWINKHRQSCFDENRDDKSISREEVEAVMENLGIFCSPESEKLKESMGIDELSQLFDEKEPSLEEVKEAFDVFDVNRDGFIDAEELQRVIRILGLKEPSDLENCRKMIRNFDENKDGRIDFNEFVKFMENNLS